MLIARRQFLGSSIAAVCAVSAWPTRYLAAADSKTLNWACDIIHTQPHRRALRAPVVTGVCIQDQGNLLAIVGDDHFVSIYDLIKRRFTHDLDQHTDWVQAARFSPDGRHLATAGNDRQLLLWNASTWDSPQVIEHQERAIFDVAFSPDSQQLAAVGFNHSLNVYDVKSSALIRRLECGCADMRAICFSADGSHIATGGRSGVIQVWNFDSESPIASFRAHQQRIRSLEFSADGMLLSCGQDQMVHINDPRAGRTIKSLPRHPSKLYDVKLIGGDLLASAGCGNLIHIWQLGQTSELGTLRGHTGTVTSLATAQNKLVSGSYDTQVRIWRMEQRTASNRRPAKQDRELGWKNEPNLK
jgi:WD40 repeat protein